MTTAFRLAKKSEEEIMKPINRRTFLTGACASLILGFTGELPAIASSSVKKLANGRLSVKLSSVPELAKVGGAVAIGDVNGTPVAIGRTGSNKYVAFSLSCPHQGATVERSNAGWRCPAHGSTFKTNGARVQGLATTGLRAVPIKISAGQAIVG